MKILLDSLLLFGLISGQLDGGKCTYSLEILQLQDASYSFLAYVSDMALVADQLLDRIETEFGEFKYGVSSWIDKPIPYRGIGAYGNFAEIVAADWCYQRHSSFTTDSTQIKNAFAALANALGSGGDYIENPFEALIAAAYDSSLGWSPKSKEFSASGRPIVRLALLITDDYGHTPDDKTNDTIQNSWNHPRDFTVSPSTGGFGSDTFPNLYAYLINDGQHTDPRYPELVQLFKKFDAGTSLTAEEQARMAELVTLYGPYPYPALLPHPGDYSMDCAKTEYPTIKQLGAALAAADIIPVFLVAGTKADSLVEYYRLIGESLLTMGVSHYVVASIDQDNVYDQILDSLTKLTDDMCLKPTDPPVDPTAAPVDPTDPPVDPTVAPVDPTAAPIDPTGAPVDPTDAPVNPDVTEAAGGDDVTADESTTTTTRKTKTPLIDSTTTTTGKKSAVAVIAGATGGAVAGVAALGALAYKKVGASLFGGNHAADMASVQQVEVPENSVERETIEEVTMDMFQ